MYISRNANALTFSTIRHTFDQASFPPFRLQFSFSDSKMEMQEYSRKNTFHTYVSHRDIVADRESRRAGKGGRDEKAARFRTWQSSLLLADRVRIRARFPIAFLARKRRDDDDTPADTRTNLVTGDPGERCSHVSHNYTRPRPARSPFCRVTKQRQDTQYF